MGFKFSLKNALNPIKHTKDVIKDPFNPGAHTLSAAGLESDIEKEKDPPNKPVIAMPDQEETKRIARRNAAKRRGGRTSTVLTGGRGTLG
jgi:hypothetical protein